MEDTRTSTEIITDLESVGGLDLHHLSCEYLDGQNVTREALAKLIMQFENCNLNIANEVADHYHTNLFENKSSDRDILNKV